MAPAGRPLAVSRYGSQRSSCGPRRRNKVASKTSRRAVESRNGRKVKLGRTESR